MDDIYQKAVVDPQIKQCIELRVELDQVLQKMHKCISENRERSLAITKLQESMMWLDMELKALVTPSPYRYSYKPENNIVDPTSDGLKL